MTVKVLRGCLLLLLLTVGMYPVAETQQEEKTGGWRLAAESSPYLRLHADNPVEWYPWGEAAFEKARKENKPLFISVGYFTCHWCHVMARESFSNPEIARLLNEGFVSIKVDREQRPDIDAAYMQYVTLTRGRGGWPMSVWAIPDGDPFVGGTYFPPDEIRGRPGMKQLLARITRLWKDDEAGIRVTAANAVASLKKLGVSAQPLAKLTDTPLAEARKQYANSYDDLQGGFGAAPKFPQPARLMFLLQDEPQASLDMALFTLDQMAAGGIHDQLGGGFHRYSTDFEWRVPHFEKMLYDQALIARACLYAYRRSGRAQYADTARAILDFTLSEMRDAQGGFHAALSADSPVPGEAQVHMEEGAGYTWSWRQLDEAIDEVAMRDWVIARYGLSEHGNAISDPLNEMNGKNVLYRARTTREMAEKFHVELITAQRRNTRGERLLLAARSKRPAIPVDDKVVAVWNGYMMTTLAMAGRLLDEPRYIEAAEQTANFVLNRLFDKEQAVLYRDWRDGKQGVPGFSEDYAAVAEGLLALYKVTGNKRWLNAARTLVDLQLEKFWDKDNGGFFSTPATTELWVREKEASDGATLSVNGISLHVLLQLGELTGQQAWLQYAWQTAAWAGAQLQHSVAAMPYSLVVWDDLTELNPK
ncbi:MAG: thioredoxin domain-containing protein [Pseudomonadota bacterium]